MTAAETGFSAFYFCVQNQMRCPHNKVYVPLISEQFHSSSALYNSKMTDRRPWISSFLRPHAAYSAHLLNPFYYCDKKYFASGSFLSAQSSVSPNGLLLCRTGITLPQFVRRTGYW